MSKPTINLKCVADGYAGTEARIAEFSNNSRSNPIGGLISLSNLPDGRLNVSLYRLDSGISVFTSHDAPDVPTAALGRVSDLLPRLHQDTKAETVPALLAALGAALTAKYGEAADA